MAKNKKGVSFYLMIVAYVVLIPILLMNILLIIDTYTDEEHIPSVFGVSPVIVLSGSMEPTFDAGALIFIKDVDVEDLEVDDVICYLSSGTAITHRIYSVSDDGEITFVTKGDANNAVDRSTVSEDQIEGKYIWHINGLGTFAMFTQTTTGMVVCIGLPVLLYLIVDFLNSRKAKSAQQDKTAQLEAELARLRGEEPPQE